jgi:hypothetical protein
VRKLAAILNADAINGGTVSDFVDSDLSGRKLVLWMADVSNDEEKHYPRKDRGATLICSKVLREGYTRADAITRIFRMHANAVLEVYPGSPVCFALVDALGHEWESKTSDLVALARVIEAFHAWTQSSIRVPSIQLDARPRPVPMLPEFKDFVALNREVADQVRRESLGRFFGNASTRCMALFPSCRDLEEGVTAAYVSVRNTDKTQLGETDFVLVHDTLEEQPPVCYYGGRKPSVDTPVQLQVYRARSGINWMIHGHALVKGAPTTEFYYPCGDLREVGELLKVIPEDATNGVVNIRNHGFLLYGDTLEGLREVVRGVSFEAR